jgi:Inverse autotransporter, beta-domain
MNTAVSVMMNFFRVVGNVFSPASSEDCLIDSIADMEIEEQQEERAVASEADPIDYCCNEYTYCIAPYRMYLSHTERGGIGYTKGYSTLGAFFNLAEFVSCWVPELEPFGDIRGHLFNDGHLAANIGVGARYINYCEAIWGASLYYDWRRGFAGNYHQVGLGFELLGKHWNLRSNLYFPTGNKQRYSSRPTVFADYLDGYVVTCARGQHALKGIDAELGYFRTIEDCYCSKFSVYSGLGQYVYHRSCAKNIVGVMGRVIFQGWDFLTLEGRFNYDPVTKGNIQGKLTFTFPFGVRSRRQVVQNDNDCCYEDVCQFKEIAALPVLRNEVIFLTDKNRYKTFDASGEHIH